MRQISRIDGKALLSRLGRSGGRRRSVLDRPLLIFGVFIVIAVVAAVGTLVPGPFDPGKVGTVGDWVSGIGSLLAVIVAVHTLRREARKTEEVFLEPFVRQAAWVLLEKDSRAVLDSFAKVRSDLRSERRDISEAELSSMLVVSHASVEVATLSRSLDNLGSTNSRPEALALGEALQRVYSVLLQTDGLPLSDRSEEVADARTVTLDSFVELVDCLRESALQHVLNPKMDEDDAELLGMAHSVDGQASRLADLADM